MSTFLSALKKGDRATILGLTGTAELNERLIRMGIVEGATLQIEHEAPFGDPLAIRIRGALVALRRSEAQIVRVEQDTTKGRRK